jgi:hypothetical protein
VSSNDGWSGQWGSGKHQGQDLCFDLGEIRWSSKVAAFLRGEAPKAGVDPEDWKRLGTRFVMMHAQGNHGDAEENFGVLNRDYIRESKGVVLSTFPYEGTRIVVVTAFIDRQTVVMLPEEVQDYDRATQQLTVTTEDE